MKTAVRARSESPEARLRRELSGFLPSGPEAIVRAWHPDHALAVMADILRAEHRRRRNARRFLATFCLYPFAANAALGMGADPAAAAGFVVVGFYVIVPFLAVTWLLTQPRLVHQNVMTGVPSLLSDATVASVPALLTIGSCLEPKRNPWQTEILRRVRETLATLLPAFLEAKALDSEQLAFLRRECIRKECEPEFRVGALLVLADIGDPEILPIAEKWSRKHPEERVREAATECLRAHPWTE